MCPFLKVWLLPVSISKCVVTLCVYVLYVLMGHSSLSVYGSSPYIDYNLKMMKYCFRSNNKLWAMGQMGLKLCSTFYTVYENIKIVLHSLKLFG